MTSPVTDPFALGDVVSGEEVFHDVTGEARDLVHRLHVNAAQHVRHALSIHIETFSFFFFSFIYFYFIFKIQK